MFYFYPLVHGFEGVHRGENSRKDQEGEKRIFRRLVLHADCSPLSVLRERVVENTREMKEKFA